MARARMGRVGVALGAASLLIAGLFAGTAQAAQANWSVEIQPTPPKVEFGTAAGFFITFTNAGPSNVSQLYYVDDVAPFGDQNPDPAPVYFESSQGSCAVTAGDLRCTLGAVNAGQTATIEVAYPAPTNGANLAYKGEVNSTGVSLNDKGKNSHGDALGASATALLAAGNGNFGGRFNTQNNGNVVNGQVLSGTNKQNAKISFLAANVGASIEDGLPNNAFSCAPACNGASFSGDWIRVIVDHGQPQGTAFQVQTQIRNPGNVDVNTAVVYHVLDTGQVQVIGDDPAERATSTAQPGTLAPEGSVFMQYVTAGNQTVLEVTVWLTQNGGIRK